MKPPLKLKMFYEKYNKVFLKKFGRDVTFKGATISAIFDDAGSIQTSGDLAIIINEPQVKVLSSDVAGIKRNDLFIIDDVTFYANNATPDGTGFSIVTLSKNEVR